MKKIFIFTTALFLFTISSSAQIKVWENGNTTFTAMPFEIDSITFGVPYPCLSLNEVCTDEGWIEIYNKSDFDINLKDVRLIKFNQSGEAETLATFGDETVNKRAYIKKEVNNGLSDAGTLKLALQTGDGTTFELFDAEKALNGEQHAEGGSYSRIPDGVGNWTIVSESSANAQNNYGKAEMPEFPITMIHDKLWTAKYAEFHKDEAIFLRLKDDQLEYDYQKGEYVYITAKEFGEDYRDKYNRDNGTSYPTEYFLRFDYDTEYYYEITFTDDMRCVIWDGVWSPNGQVASMNVSGSYKLDENTGIIYIRDTESNSLYDKEIEIQVSRDPDNENGLIFEIIKNKVLDPMYDRGFDFDMFDYSFYDYDQVYKYFPAKKILYHCEEAETGHH